MNHLKQFQKEEEKEFDKLIQDYGNKIYDWYPKRYDTESIEAIKIYLHQRDERLISLLKSQIEALDVSEMFSEQVKSEILKLL